MSQRRQSLDAGLLVIRVGIGCMFLKHGWPKISGGPEMWEDVGNAVATVGLQSGFVYWGFLAALSEFGGSLCLITGVLFRPAALCMTGTMAMATWMHLSGGDSFNTWSHAAEAGFVFLGLLVAGPGRYRLGRDGR